MGHRSDRFRIRKEDAADTKQFNRRFKVKEQARRDARMLGRVRSGSLPYAPEVMSWLSTKLEKKSTRITAEDVTGLVRTCS